MNLYRQFERLIFALLGCALSSVCVAQERSPLPPLEAFFGPATLQSAQLSPSGRWLAVQVAPPGERTRLVVMDLEGKEKSMVLAKFSRADVDSFFWLNEEFLLFSVSDTADRSGRTRFPGLFAVNRDGENLRMLIKRDLDTLFAAPGGQPLEANHEILSRGAPGTDEIIVGEIMFGPPTYEIESVRPLALNVRTGGRRSLLKDYPPSVADWLFDRQGRPRVATSRWAGRTTFHWHELATGEWRQLGEFPVTDTPYWPQFVDEKHQLYVQVAEGERGSGELRRFDLTTGKADAGVLVATPGFDASIDVIQDPGNGDLLGYSVLTDARTTAWVTPELQALQAKVDAFLPGRLNTISCRPCDKPKVLLVHSRSDRSPGDYLVLHTATNSWQRIGAVRPAIDPARMSRVEFHRTKARDGGDLPVWITRSGGVNDKPRPAVVLVHGGPWRRGSEWGWDAEAQFLASRGYVVIEPEFRGSTGYGDAHFRAGWKQWGQAMQDDVTDSLRFAVQRGWVDASRVCIAGASYGGYATLMGLAKDPDLYRCGVAWAAVSDPRLLFSVFWSDISRASRLYSMPQMVGDPKADAAMLAANAPVELAKRIKAPLLLAHGSSDKRVPVEHGERMRAALREAGNEPQWVLYDDEKHTWSRTETKLDFWKRVEAFLAQHLKP